MERKLRMILPFRFFFVVFMVTFFCCCQSKKSKLLSYNLSLIGIWKVANILDSIGNVQADSTILNYFSNRFLNIEKDSSYTTNLNGLFEFGKASFFTKMNELTLILKNHNNISYIYSIELKNGNLNFSNSFLYNNGKKNL